MKRRIITDNEKRTVGHKSTPEEQLKKAMDKKDYDKAYKIILLRVLRAVNRYCERRHGNGDRTDPTRDPGAVGAYSRKHPRHPLLSGPYHAKPEREEEGWS